MLWRRAGIRTVSRAPHVESRLAQVHSMSKRANRIAPKVTAVDFSKELHRLDPVRFHIDYRRMFQAKCTACEFPIEPGDQYLEAMGGTLHVECFNCSVGVNPFCCGH